MFQLRSSIKPELMKRALFRGSLIGGAGALLILVMGFILPLDQIMPWGFLSFLVGIGLITFGLFPYRKLSKLELKPHEIHLDDRVLLFLKNGKPLFQVPLSVIKRVDYHENETLYGIGIALNHPLEEKIVVLERRFNFEAFLADSMQRFEGCDLFLPFFSRRAVQEIQDFKHPTE